eukprot:scaffold220059_cov30-Tisochrysis_lutea.AAC.6
MVLGQTYLHQLSWRVHRDLSRPLASPPTTLCRRCPSERHADGPVPENTATWLVLVTNVKKDSRAASRGALSDAGETPGDLATTKRASQQAWGRRPSPSESQDTLRLCREDELCAPIIPALRENMAAHTTPAAVGVRRRTARKAKRSHVRGPSMRKAQRVPDAAARTCPHIKTSCPQSQSPGMWLRMSRTRTYRVMHGMGEDTPVLVWARFCACTTTGRGGRRRLGMAALNHLILIHETGRGHIEANRSTIARSQEVLNGERRRDVDVRHSAPSGRIVGVQRIEHAVRPLLLDCRVLLALLALSVRGGMAGWRLRAERHKSLEVAPFSRRKDLTTVDPRVTSLVRAILA